MNYLLSLYQKYSYLSNKITYLFVFLFLFSLFFPIRHVFLTNFSYITGEYSDFTSISLYLSDILGFFIIIFYIIPRGGIFLSSIKNIKWLLICAFLMFLVNSSLFSIYFLLQFIKIIVAYGTVVVLVHENVINKRIIAIFAGFCTLQSILATWQFLSQTSFGLYKIGESHLSPSILGVAKIVSGGTTYIRGYGTFPHPNPLSAFLVIGILTSTYLLLQSKAKILRTTLYLFTFINMVGLTVTFSRAGYISACVGLVIFFVYNFSQKTTDRKTIFKAVATIFLSVIACILLFKPFILTRATFSDKATIERRFYNNTGIQIIKNHVLAGVGMGESLLHMEQYSGRVLQPWQKQPPHNYFIIVAAEMGLIMLLLILLFLSKHILFVLRSLINSNTQEEKQYFILLGCIFVSILVLMMFDHYFYTLEQTKLLLWITLGIIAAKKPLQN